MNATEISRWLADLEAARFFGSIEMKLESGRVVLIRKVETFKSIGRGCGDNPGEDYAKANS